MLATNWIVIRLNSQYPLLQSNFFGKAKLFCILRDYHDFSPYPWSFTVECYWLVLVTSYLAVHTTV